MQSHLVTLKNVFFQYENSAAIFEHIDLDIPKGEIVAIMGPSGTGKTTLLRLIGGQLKPILGQVSVAGHLIHELSRSHLYTLRKRIGMLFQASGLLTHLNVFENVAFPLRAHTLLSNSMIRTLVLMKLQMVGLRGAQTLMPGQLSGGMVRRVALARAISLDAELLLYDEPFSGQDPISTSVLVQLIRTLNDALGLTSIIVSHDVQATFKIADYVYIISNKKVIGSGTPEQMMKSTDPQLKQFVCGFPDGPVAFDYPANTLQYDFLE